MSWRESLCRPGMTIRDAIQAIDDGAIQICLVIDDDDRLVGTVTDGDVRRAILRGLDVAAPIETIMNRSPVTARQGDTPQAIMATMRRAHIRQVPLLDADGQIIDLALLDEISGTAEARDNIVVLMAGGLGARLRPLTEDTPKPLLPVGNKPLLEIILEGFVEQGFTDFRISVNYKAEMIKSHFGDGARWGANIRYLEESERAGTAGGLRSLAQPSDAPILVMNGDLLTKVNYRHLLDFHHQHEAAATMCVREYDWQIPFGVVELSGHNITSIVEKPKHHAFINAGIYVLNPGLLELIPADGSYDMTDLLQDAARQGLKTAAFPIREYWLDVGYADDLARADGEFREFFGE